MGAAIKHHVPDWVKQSFVIFDIRAFLTLSPEHHSALMSNYKWRLNPVRHRMLYSSTHMATEGVKGLIMTGEHSSCRLVSGLNHTNLLCSCETF